MGIWDRENYGTIAETTFWFMFSFITVIISLRIYCRLRYSTGGLIRGLGVDDIITILCWAIFLATCIIVSVGASRGMGKHVDALLAQRQLTEALKWGVITSSVSLWVFSLPKCALVALLQRILNYGTKTTTLFWGDRVTISILLSLNALACVVSVYKLVMYDDILSMTAQDPSFAIAYLNILGVSEGFILLICASLSTLGPLLRGTRVRSKLSKSAGSGPSQLQQPTMDSHSSSGEDLWRGNRHPNPDAGSIRQYSPRVGLDEIPLVVSPQHTMGLPESAV
ncbi:putative Integral membrane protein [Seiridium unicorne]|uniref:Integral membrane protein n=1 Tax=Seiridium unicorne TaxID=138068 RepID=A0ABR2VGU3_9PEZI